MGVWKLSRKEAATLSNDDLLIGPLQGQSLATMMGEFPKQLINLVKSGSLDRRKVVWLLYKLHLRVIKDLLFAGGVVF